MSDIVERIRNRINDAPMPTEHLLDEAAGEIERLYTLAKANNDLARRHADTITALRVEVERLREALEAIDKRYINGADAKTLVWIARSALAKAPA